MPYKIKMRGGQYVVTNGGKEVGVYRLLAEATKAIETSEHTPAPAAPKAQKSRSSLYREADMPGTVSNVLKRIFPRKGAVLRHTEKSYYESPIWDGADPADVKKWHQTLAHKLKVKAATSKAAAAKQERDAAAGRGAVLRDQALALIAGGLSTKAIHGKLNVSESYIRRLKRRQK